MEIRGFRFFRSRINELHRTVCFKGVLLAMLGMGTGTACGQREYGNADVEAFSELMTQPDVQLVDVRTAEEYAEGHIAEALNIDVKANDFVVKATQLLDATKPVAVYCRSGKRSAHAATLLAKEGFHVTNLLGGIMAWKEKQMPTTTVEVDTFTTPGGKTVKCHALMHASIRIVYDGKEIEIDPVGKLGNRTIDYATMPKADYILVTHEHHDHFDKEAIATLSADGSTSLVTNRRCADMLGHGQTLANGKKTTLDEGIEVEAVPAYNITEGHTQFHPKGRDNGYILTLDGLRIYIAGDTEDIPEMENIKDIDIAFLPCNQPYTMTTDQLLRAARVIKPRILFPYHYSQTDVSRIPNLLKDDGIDVRIRHYE